MLIGQWVSTLRYAALFSAAFSRARARLTEGNPPRPISRRRPSMVMRCTQDLLPALLMYRCRPPPKGNYT